MNDSLLVELDRRLDLVGLDAPDVEGLLRGQGLHQRVHRVLEDRAGRQRALRRLRDVVSAFRPHRPEVSNVYDQRKKFQNVKKKSLIVVTLEPYLWDNNNRSYLFIILYLSPRHKQYFCTQNWEKKNFFLQNIEVTFYNIFKPHYHFLHKL